MNGHDHHALVPHDMIPIKPRDPLVLIVSDTPSRAHLIRRLLSGSCVGEFTVDIRPLPDSLNYLRGKSCKLIILDAQHDSTDQLHVLKLVRAAASNVHILMVAGSHNPTMASRALRAGASAYIPANDLPKVIVQAITKIVAGERFVSEEVMQGILHGMMEIDTHPNGLPVERLSDREMSVFQLLSHGKNLRTIAGEIGINIKTVTTHCNNIRRKFHIANNHELAEASREWADQREPR